MTIVSITEKPDLAGILRLAGFTRYLYEDVPTQAEKGIRNWIDYTHPTTERIT